MKVLLLFAILCMNTAFAGVIEKSIEYKDGDAVLEGFLYYNETQQEKKPGVIVVHEWMGLDEYAKKRARELAEQGYVTFAADIYGKGVRAKDQKEAGELAGKYRNGDRKVLRSRINAALKVLKAQPQVDKKNTFAMGYCFGGTTVLELARSGADVKGVVSFHGGLSNINPKDARKIKGSVLVLHGAVDPYVSADELNGFIKEMEDAKVDYQLVSYAGAVHGFTNPKGGNDASKGYAYNKKADMRSWNATLEFFKELTK